MSDIIKDVYAGLHKAGLTEIHYDPARSVEWHMKQLQKCADSYGVKYVNEVPAATSTIRALVQNYIRTELRMSEQTASYLLGMSHHGIGSYFIPGALIHKLVESAFAAASLNPITEEQKELISSITRKPFTSLIFESFSALSFAELLKHPRKNKQLITEKFRKHVVGLYTFVQLVNFQGRSQFILNVLHKKPQPFYFFRANDRGLLESMFSIKQNSHGMLYLQAKKDDLIGQHECPNYHEMVAPCKPMKNTTTKSVVNVAKEAAEKLVAKTVEAAPIATEKPAVTAEAPKVEVKAITATAVAPKVEATRMDLPAGLIPENGELTISVGGYTITLSHDNKSAKVMTQHKLIEVNSAGYATVY